MNIWDANWIPNIESLRNVISVPLNKNEDNLTINDIWDNQGWDLEKISFNLPQLVTNSIHALDRD